MKKRHILYKVTAAVWLTISFPSCEIETSNNGKLDGYWHLNSVDTLSTGGTLDLSEETRFWAIQTDLLNVVDRGGTAGNFMFRFEHKDGKLRLYDPHKNAKLEGDPAVESADSLNPFGVNALDETFNVETLSNSRMILSTDTLCLHFNKM